MPAGRSRADVQPYANGLRVVLAFAGAALACAPVAVAASGSGSGGAGYVLTPQVKKVGCARACPPDHARAYPGSTLRVSGAKLSDVRKVTFLGGRGRSDDVSVAVKPATDRSLRLRVPRKARSGRLAAVAGAGDAVGRSPRSLAIVPPPPKLDPGELSPDGHLFPVRGSHNFGEAGARFGAPRSGHTHQGQDIMASCGIPLVAARGGVVKFKQYQSAAGNYIVIDGDDTGVDYAYMHLKDASPFKAGDRVATGQQIGVVGRTGDATACHLHFEMWSAPGWYDGGKPFDPLPYLKSWDRTS